jgi:hypothetical protein
MKSTVRLFDFVNQLVGSGEPHAKVWDTGKLVSEAQKLNNDLFKLGRYISRQMLEVVATVVDLTILRSGGEHHEHIGLVRLLDDCAA